MVAIMSFKGLNVRDILMMCSFWEQVAITPEITSKNFSREILNKLVQDHKAFLGKRIPAYDGKKSLYTAGPLPFTSKEFVVDIVRERRGER